MLVYVLNQHSKPLMPCKPQKARKLLESGKAKVVSRAPFTNAVRLTARTTTLTQIMEMAIHPAA